MADSFIRIPVDDAAFTGKKVRTQTRVVGADTVHEHYFIIQDETSDFQATVTAAGALKVDNSEVTQPVSASSLPLPTGAATSALQTQPGVDIGDVTVNNGAGASAVNIQDGGNTITVDGTVAATQSGAWNVTNVSGTVSLPTGASTAANQATEIASLQLIDGTVADLTNTAPSRAILIAGVGTMGAALSPFVDLSGNLYTSTQLSAAIPAGTNNIGDVDVLSVVPGTAATNLGKAEDAGHTTGDVGVMALGVANTANANISGTTLDYTPYSTDLTGAVRVIGNIAHDSADSGPPLKVGGIARVANPTAVTALDRVDAYYDDLGCQVVVLSSPRDLVVQQTTTISASTTETTIGTAGASGIFHDITMITVSNTSASTNTRIDFRDATAGTVRFSLQSPGNSVVGFVPQVPITQTTAANNWTAQCSASTTDIRILIQMVKKV